MYVLYPRAARVRASLVQDDATANIVREQRRRGERDATRPRYGGVDVDRIIQNGIAVDHDHALGRSEINRTGACNAGLGVAAAAKRNIVQQDWRDRPCGVGPD